MSIRTQVARETPSTVFGTVTATNVQQAMEQIATGATGGTVTSVSVTAQNGVSATVTTPTTTPALAFTLGAITPSSVASTGAVSGTTGTFSGAVSASNISGSTSGTNTGDQTITLTGDVTGSGTGTFATTLANTAVTPGAYTSANITIDSKGRITAAASGGGGTVTTTGSPANGNLTKFSGASSITNGDLSGDVTTSGTLVTTIANDAVTNAKLANMANSTVKGRTTAGTGDPEDMTALQTAAIVQGDGTDVDLCGFRGLPQNSQSVNYTIVAADAGKHILHPSGGGAGDTFTIPANASVAFEVGTTLTFVNMDSNSISIAITTDTMTLANSTTTGTRTLAQNSWATAIKVTSTGWLISGPGLT